MPRREYTDDDPLGIKGTRAIVALVPGLHLIGLADPERFDDDHLARVERALKRRDVVALKAYLGYLHHEPNDPGYRPYYKLAAKYDIPVIFHTGDTYSQSAKVKYAHPRFIDDVAVDFPDTRFVIAHLGNPWHRTRRRSIPRTTGTGRTPGGMYGPTCRRPSAGPPNSRSTARRAS